jgi:hypothetical protein
MNLPKAIERKEGITARAVRYRVAKARRDHPTITQEEALLLVAAEAGITVSDYTDDRASLSLVRQLQRGEKTATPASAPAPKRVTAPRSIQVNISTGPLTDPILPERVIKEARMMAEQVYPQMYLFENSVREVIQRVMRHAYGKDWWDKRVEEKRRKSLAGRMSREQGRHWHGKRGAHPIYYSDIGDLVKIIENDWNHFSDLFDSIEWVTQRIKEINVSRRVIAHNNPLHPDDLKRVEVYYSDWRRQIEGVRDKIP